jgi:hypothetical protein
MNNKLLRILTAPWKAWRSKEWRLSIPFKLPDLRYGVPILVMLHLFLGTTGFKKATKHEAPTPEQQLEQANQAIPLDQEQELGGKAKGKVRKSEEAAPRRVVIGPVTISIPDESALINVLRPFSTPPDPLSIVFEDGRVVLVHGIEWQTAPASGTAKTALKGIKWCDCGGKLGRHMCPESWSCADCCEVIKKAFEARTLLPRDGDYGPVLVFDAKQTQGRFLDPTERMFKEELSKIDGILSQAGLQRVSGRKKATRSNLFSSGLSPAQRNI